MYGSGQVHGIAKTIIAQENISVKSFVGAVSAVVRTTLARLSVSSTTVITGSTTMGFV